MLAVSFELEASERSAPIRYAELARALGVEVGARAPLGRGARAVLALRRGKGMVLDPDDPDTVSAGSFFTNPVLDADAFAALQARAAERLGPDARPPAWPDADAHVKTSAAWLIERAGPAGAGAPVTGGEPPRAEAVRVPAGRATLGVAPGELPFAWDNELPRMVVDVPAFSIDVHSVTNRDFLGFVEAGGYDREELWGEEGWRWRTENGVCRPVFWEERGGALFWRGQWEDVPLPSAWPVYVSHAEASAYARWKGRRLPTEGEYHRAAFGAPGGRERPLPWGDEPPDQTRGNFDFRHADPVPAGSHPAGASAWGVHDLVGNGWEWTSTVFGGFPGFEPLPSYPNYSADFFDGKHFVLKGASPATAKELVRRSFRNWFRGNYPYVYAKFRCVS